MKIPRRLPAMPTLLSTTAMARHARPPCGARASYCLRRPQRAARVRTRTALFARRYACRRYARTDAMRR